MRAVVVRTTEIETPVGAIVVARNGDRICALGFADRWVGIRKSLERRFGNITWQADEVEGAPGRALRHYFAGDLSALDSVEVDTAGTPFQEKVWKALRRIPPGRTISYSELARAVGSPSAVRAVAGANARNPVSIVVPCHRVVAADGTLAGYGGGVARKEWLLVHEGARLV